jgi:competence/damage-inducible protein CinA-like protein
MRVEIVAVGTELLLGQIADTNSAWLGEHLAENGIDSHFHQAVGDNHTRIVLALRTALARSDGVIVCGGLGPTQDDITREAIAEVMNTELDRDESLVEAIRRAFQARNRQMPDSNLRQADVPRGALPIPQVIGTAPGLICPVGHKVVYAVPGVPYEMEEMFERAILPDLRNRIGENATIKSRVVRVWGMSESGLADLLAPRLEALDAAGGNPTIAFLASGIEGIKVRITAKAPDDDTADALLADEVSEVVALIGEPVFSTVDAPMEQEVARLLRASGLSLGLAESLTGGLVASRLVDVEGASDWFKGSVVAYDPEVKYTLLDVPRGPVVSETAAIAMAEHATTVLGSDIGLSLTGVAGPAEQDRMAPGTVFVGLAQPGLEPECVQMHLPGDRLRVRQYATISALDLLRRRLANRQ